MTVRRQPTYPCCVCGAPTNAFIRQIGRGAGYKPGNAQALHAEVACSAECILADLRIWAAIERLEHGRGVDAEERSRVSALTDIGLIYVASFERWPDAVKIGFSQQVERRLKTLRRTHGVPLVHLCVPGTMLQEQRLHHRFAESRYMPMFAWPRVPTELFYLEAVRPFFRDVLLSLMGGCRSRECWRQRQCLFGLRLDSRWRLSESRTETAG